MNRLPGFSMPPSITVWSDPMAPVVLADYLRLQGLTLKLAQSPPVEEWTRRTKPAITCNHCGVTTSSTINHLQQGQGIPCLCSGKGSLTQRWYYERVIARPFADRDGRVWYAKLHDGRLAKPSWEEWLAAAEQGAKKGKLRLTCLHCGVTISTTTIHSLQQGQGISCLCSPAKGSLKERWYYDRAIAQPFTDRDGRVWYAKLHDGSLAKPSWEDWLAAAELGNQSKLRLTCLHCGVTTSTTSISRLQQGGGRSCKCATSRT
jgi:ribosomal protein L44E